jgi:glycosyltransferase involved in cell wall biosynthesis
LANEELKSERIVAFENSGSVLSAYFKQMLTTNISGYRFVLKRNLSDMALKPFIDSKKFFFSVVTPILRQNGGNGKMRFPFHYYKAKVDSFFRFGFPRADLTYSWNHLVFRHEPWILDQEYIFAVMGYRIDLTKKYRSLIERALNDEYNKAILCSHRLAIKTIDILFPGAKFRRKVRLVWRASQKRVVKRAFDTDPVTIVFAGTINEPGAFEYKGGKEAVEAYRRLRAAYGSKVRMVIRSDVPRHIRLKMMGVEGAFVIDYPLDPQRYGELLSKSDIFLLPSHTTPAEGFIVAASYGLPVVTVNEMANGEIVLDRKTGIVVDKPQAIPTLEEALRKPELTDIWEEQVRVTHGDTVEQLVQALSELVDKPAMRKELSYAAKAQVDSGRFSISRRNAELKRVFDLALNRVN